MPEQEESDIVAVRFIDTGDWYRMGEDVPEHRAAKKIELAPMSLPGFYCLKIERKDETLLFAVSPSVIVLELSTPKVVQKNVPPRLVIPISGRPDNTIN